MFIVPLLIHVPSKKKERKKNIPSKSDTDELQIEGKKLLNTIGSVKKLSSFIKKN